MTTSHCIPEAMNMGSAQLTGMEEQPKTEAFHCRCPPYQHLDLELKSRRTKAIQPSHSSWWYEIDSLLFFLLLLLFFFFLLMLAASFGIIYGHSGEQKKLEGQNHKGSHDQICA